MITAIYARPLQFMQGVCVEIYQILSVVEPRTEDRGMLDSSSERVWRSSVVGSAYEVDSRYLA